jgi:hypothetical protein
MDDLLARPIVLQRGVPAERAVRTRRASRLAAADAPAPQPLKTKSTRKQTLQGLAVIAAFAFSYLQFAMLPFQAAPAEQRVNNGSQPTFFAFHINPYGVTSEDFHLYVVRAKRILDRGWTNSPLTTRFESGRNYTAPLQVLLCMLAVQTDGQPLPYSIYISCVFFCGWGTLFLVARRFLSSSVPTTTIILGVMIAVLFEGIQNFFTSQFDSNGIWPAHRHMRMATLAWTTPLILAALITATSIWFNRASRMLAAGVVGFILLVLTGVDNWAFSLVFVPTGFIGFTLGAGILFDLVRRKPIDFDRWKVTIAMGLALAASYGTHRLLTHRIAGDALMRSGLGEAWHYDRRDLGLWTDLCWHWLLPWGALAIAVMILPSAVQTIRARKAGTLQWLVQLRLGPVSRWQFLCIGLLSVAAMLTVLQIAHVGGMEPYVRYQLIWRVDLLLLFSLIMCWAEALRGLFTTLSSRIPRLVNAWSIITVCGIAALFAYHQYRIHSFAVNTVAREYFLTADAEALRPWLEKYDREHKDYSIATLSPELNYLCAYWTNADLMLPSGFPYHNTTTNMNIRRGMIDLLRLYNASSQAWKDFTLPRPIHFTDAWRVSRVDAAGLSYLYQLYHRVFMLDSESHSRWRNREIHSIALALDESPTTSPVKPEILLVDEVSQSLGHPILEDYELAFTAGSIQAWVRTTAGSSVQQIALAKRTKQQLRQ